MAVAAATIASAGAFKNPKLKAIIDVDTDKNGRFKYILIKVHDPEKDREFKHIIRGYSRHEYHADIYDDVCPKIEKNNLDCECVGGGRIQIENSKKHIQIFGYSKGYGQADHAITAAILSRKYPEHKVKWSNEGY
ncbi:14 kDa phosphohistidine phosphatase-like [Argonauta hians]